MSYIFEVYYAKPRDVERETIITNLVLEHGGSLDYREQSDGQTGSICLTYEFASLCNAEQTATLLRLHGDYVEGPYEYGDD